MLIAAVVIIAPARSAPMWNMSSTECSTGSPSSGARSWLSASYLLFLVESDLKTAAQDTNDKKPKTSNSAPLTHSGRKVAQ